MYPIASLFSNWKVHESFLNDRGVPRSMSYPGLCTKHMHKSKTWFTPVRVGGLLNLHLQNKVETPPPPGGSSLNLIQKFGYIKLYLQRTYQANAHVKTSYKKSIKFKTRYLPNKETSLTN
jgi:hypothetical protein